MKLNDVLNLAGGEPLNEKIDWGKLATIALGTTIGVLSQKSPNAALALTVASGAAMSGLLGKPRSQRQLVTVTAANEIEVLGQSKHVQDMINKHGYKLKNIRALPKNGLQWDLEL